MPCDKYLNFISF